MKTAFEHVSDMNTLVGNLPTSSYDDIRSQMDIIAEEVYELRDAIEDEDLTEVRDGVADVKVTVFGLMHRMKVPYFDAVVRATLQCEFADLHVNDETTFKFLEAASEEDPVPESHVLWTRAAAICYSLKEDFDAMKAIVADIDNMPMYRRFLIQRSARIILLAEMIAAALDFDSDADDLLVHESNMSKFDTNREDLEKTIQKYRDLGITTYIVEGKVDDQSRYVVKVAEARDSKGQLVDFQTDKNGRKQRVGKFLKSHLWKEPVFN